MRKQIALFLLCAMLTGCASPASVTSPETQPDSETTPEVVQPVYQPVVKADGSADSIFYADCYETSAEISDAPAAQWGEDTLSARQLQVYYNLVLSEYRQSGVTPQPEADIPLWAQLCPVEGGVLSWEQFFLRRAISLWQSVCALNEASALPPRIDDSGYQPDENLHQQYITEDMPVISTIYGAADSYEMPAMHRQYIENLPEYLHTLPQSKGMDAGILLSVCTEINRAYSFYTALNATAESTAVSPEEPRVNIRQMLILPEGDLSADGTVNAEPASWDKALASAESCLTKWQKTYAARVHPEASFANLCHDMSVDSATALDGGLLNKIAPGQLLAPLDAWCFAPERQAGDYAAIPTEKGISVVYFIGKDTAESRSTAMQQTLNALLQAHALSVDYSAVALADINDSPCLSDILYPDVGHEQIDEIPTFFQQDYPYVNCGGVSMPIGGCGLASLAMLATYMSDSLITPTEIAERYAKQYGSKTGTNGDIYTRVTPELGFYCSGIYHQWSPVVEIMSEGQQVINLQMNGPFTTGGHYILLAHLRSDGKVVVRDPSIKHYQKLYGFREGAFEPKTIQAGATQFWTFDKKILTIPACSRCGNEKSYALSGNYLCRKCLIATDRRDSFMANAMKLQS